MVYESAGPALSVRQISNLSAFFLSSAKEISHLIRGSSADLSVVDDLASYLGSHPISYPLDTRDPWTNTLYDTIRLVLSDHREDTSPNIIGQRMRCYVKGLESVDTASPDQLDVLMSKSRDLGTSI